MMPVRIRPRLRVVAPAPEPQTSESLDDGQLVAAVRVGDSRAAAALYDRLRPRVDGVVRRLLGAADPDREDLVQVAFVELVRSFDAYRGECPLEHFAASVAAHAVFKHLRRRSLERRVFGRAADLEAETPDPVSASRRAEATDVVARVRDVLAKMKPDKALPFVLHDVMGFDLKEIAPMIGVTLAAAQRRLARGRRELRARLEADPELCRALQDLEDAP